MFVLMDVCVILRRLPVLGAGGDLSSGVGFRFVLGRCFVVGRALVGLFGFSCCSSVIFTVTRSPGPARCPTQAAGVRGDSALSLVLVLCAASSGACCPVASLGPALVSSGSVTAGQPAVLV